MKVGIIGVGKVGRVLGHVLADNGHEVLFSFSRDPHKPASLAGSVGERARAGTPREAVEFGEVVLFAPRFIAAYEALEAMGPLGGKVLIDCTNPLELDRSGLSIGHTTSAAEEIAKRATGARVVKAFSTAFQEVMSAPEELFGPHTPTMFHCGDDGAAKEVVAGLVREAGFEPVDAGPLKQARYLEPLAFLVISLAARGWGRNFTMTLLRAGAPAPAGGSDASTAAAPARRSRAS